MDCGFDVRKGIVYVQYGQTDQPSAHNSSAGATSLSLIRYLPKGRLHSLHCYYIIDIITTTVKMNVSVTDSPSTHQTEEAKAHQAWSIDAHSPWFPTVHFTWFEKEKYNKIFYKSVKCSFSLCVTFFFQPKNMNFWNRHEKNEGADVWIMNKWGSFYILVFYILNHRC